MFTGNVHGAVSQNWSLDYSTLNFSFGTSLCKRCISAGWFTPVHFDTFVRIFHTAVVIWSLADKCIAPRFCYFIYSSKFIESLLWKSKEWRSLHDKLADVTLVPTLRNKSTLHLHFMHVLSVLYILNVNFSTNWWMLNTRFCKAEMKDVQNRWKTWISKT